ncbi:MAG: NADPH-dependent 7-cyano-7-deazaguanine reductase QueF [Candidatus Aminicenantes bacterium RBG_13_62_12]|nr:MAG: NADPH-dependent 7-cyano-7-deazaguanine reductase QueF [Candidatus Aminicenantes bacterium RBG_13_62_12]
MKKKSSPVGQARYGEREARAGLASILPEIATFPNQFRDYEIVIDIPEFTSVCPKTGLPDFGTVTIRYEPSRRCLELKSLKEYILGYRNMGIFQENAVNRILEDVARACLPAWAVVRGEFNPRGGITTVVEARYPRRRSGKAKSG